MHVPLNTVLNANGMTLADLGEKFQFITERAAEYARVIATFGESSMEAAVAFKRFQEAIASGKGFAAATSQAERFKNALDLINAAIVQAATDALVALGTQIGGILAGINHGFRGLGGILKAILGQMLITIGTVMIAAGVAGKLIKHFVMNPIAAIAGGVALVALGSALAASAQSAVDNAGGGGGGGGGSSSAAVSDVGGGSSGGADNVLILELHGDAVISAIFADPRNQDALAEALQDLSGRSVRVEPRSVG